MPHRQWNEMIRVTFVSFKLFQFVAAVYLSPLFFICVNGPRPFPWRCDQVSVNIRPTGWLYPARPPPGIGIYMNTSTGLARIHDSRVRHNGADGIKFVQHDTQIPRREVDGTPVTDFCSSGTIAQQIFPIYTVAQQFKTSYRPIQCQKVTNASAKSVTNYCLKKYSSLLLTFKSSNAAYSPITSEKRSHISTESVKYFSSSYFCFPCK